VNYFSLKEGASVNSNNLNSLNLCEFGFALNGKCLKGKLISEEDCSISGYCLYKGFDGKTYNSTENCKCGVNNFGGKFCDLSAEDPKNLNIINLYKNLLNQNSTLCHTTERFKLCLASAFDTNNDDKDRDNKKIFSTNNRFNYDKEKRNINNILTLNSNLFKNNPDDYCGFSVMGEFNNYIVPSDSVQSCPIYKCESNIKNCLQSFNPNNNNSSGIIISLNENICKENEYCNYDISNTKMLEKYRGNCLIKNTKKPIALKRYPGEQCKQDPDCINGLCVNNICYSKKLGEICDPNSSEGIHGCGLNLFCAPKKNTTDLNLCENLKQYSQECTNTHECEMDTICYNGVCSKEYFSFENGRYINPDYIKDNFIRENVNYLCQSFYFSSKDNKCAEYKIINGNNTDSENGYVECDISNKDNSCVYEILYDDKNNEFKTHNFTRECKCGFNTEGKAYCPIDNYHCNFFMFIFMFILFFFNILFLFYLVKSKFINLIRKYIALFTNKNCNSYNRYNCDVSLTALKEIENIKDEINNHHLYYKSPSCANSVLQGNKLNLRTSLFWISVLILLIFNLI
jgi:hypothetical protein